MREIWRDVISLPNIQASNFGNIRTTMRKRNGIDFIVYSQMTGKPYPYKRVLITVGDKRRAFMVNRLVCEAFKGSPPSKSHQAAHKNGKHDDNRSSNLYWATPKRNCFDKRMHGTHIFGESVCTNKLNEKQVFDIRCKLKKGKIVADIAREYGVVWQTVANIRDRKTWDYLK